jgi:hypothetical protein
MDPGSSGTSKLYSLLPMLEIGGDPRNSVLFEAESGKFVNQVSMVNAIESFTEVQEDNITWETSIKMTSYGIVCA